MLQFCLFSLNNFFFLLLEGWGRAGSSPQYYQMGVDYTTFYEKAVKKIINYLLKTKFFYINIFELSFHIINNSSISNSRVVI